MNSLLVRQILDCDLKQDPPLFDWRDCLEDADAIINELKKPIPPRIGVRRAAPSPGLDLSKHRESLARFLAELHESYLVARNDHELRNSPDKPSPVLEDNWQSSESDPTYDYGADAGAGWELGWEEYWRLTYGRGRGNPGRNRTPSKHDLARPDLTPLRMNYPAIVRWWKDATGGSFNPEFAATRQKNAADEPFERNNPAARFLILVAQELEELFDPANVRGLYDTARKQERTRREKADK